MPYVCCIPGCRGNYKTGPKVHCFQFPSNKNLRKKWVDAIPRKDFVPTKHSKVCQFHFPKDKLIFSSTVCDSRTGQFVTVKLAFPKLSVGAVPSVFPKFPKHVENIIDRLTDDVKSETVSQRNVSEAIENSGKDNEVGEETVCYYNFDDFLTVLKSFPLPRHWNKIVTNEKVMFFKLIDSPGPVITYSVVINTTLKVNTFLYGQEIHMSIMKIADTELKTPFFSNNIHEIKDLLSEIDKCDEQFKSNSKENNNSRHILNHVSNIIDSVIPEYENSERNNILSFISEQLKLVTACNERYRYSNNTLIVSSILHVLSFQAYNFLRHAELYVLPHPKTIASICGPLTTDRIVEDRDICLQHASDIFQSLTEKDKHVILTFNEILINPCNGSLTIRSAQSVKSVLAFTLTSIKSSFKEVVYIVPIHKNFHDMVFSLIKAVIVKLEGIGYKVFCVVSNNNAGSSKAMSHFATPNQLSIVYPHPVSKNRPLFYLFDTLQLLKCIHGDWLSCKLDQSFHYPHIETGVEKVADFYSLKELYRLQYDTLLKSGYSLSWKALCPTKLERRNVELILQVFNPLIVQALGEFGGSIDKSKDTAEFINIILTWWDIVNVKTARRKPIKEEHQKPVTLGDDRQIFFLEKMLNWLNTWKESQFSNKLAPQTHMALTHTIYGLLEVTKYCFNELHMDYVLFGKFQGDDLAYRFGKCTS